MIAVIALEMTKAYVAIKNDNFRYMIISKNNKKSIFQIKSWKYTFSWARPKPLKIDEKIFNETKKGIAIENILRYIESDDS